MTDTDFVTIKSHQRVIRERIAEALQPGSQLTWLLPPNNPSLQNSIIKEIDYKTASTIILPYEWIGTMPLPKSIRYMFGIYFNDTLGGALVYVEPSTRQFNNLYPRKVVQLNRGAVAHWTPKNTASRLIGESIRVLKNDGVIAVIAYCTPEAGEVGTIYQACNFIYTGRTSPSKSYYLDEHWVSERTLADKVAWAKTRSEAWQAKFKNLPERVLQGKFRYVLPIGTAQENKQFMKTYQYNSLPYPKRILEESCHS